MPIRKCSTCGVEWTSALSKCPMCGGAAVEREGPTGKIILKSPPPAPAREDDAMTPVDLGAELRAELGEGPPIPAPIAAPPVPAPAPPPPPPPPPPRPVPPPVPTSTLPLVLGILAFLGSLILPLTFWYEGRKLLGIPVGKIGYAASAALALLAPYAWLLGQGRIDRLRALHREPGFACGAARVFGVIATFCYVAQFATLGILEAIARWTGAR